MSKLSFQAKKYLYALRNEVSKIGYNYAQFQIEGSFYTLIVQIVSELTK